MKEADFGSFVEDAFDLYEWRWTHFRPAINQRGRWMTALSGAKGWPDYAACRAERFLVAELKSDKGKLSPEQTEWRDGLVMAGIEYHLWRPSDASVVLSCLK